MYNSGRNMGVMNEKQNRVFPYKPLGNRLKRLREKMQESLAEVSGAVEIDIAQLTEIEKGLERPSEDILLLLISHFSIKDEEATRLWELASYNQQDAIMPDDSTSRQSLMLMPGEPRISYTDMVHVMVNNYGVVMNFMQATGPSNQPLSVARVGMSREHAKSVLELLQRTLAQSEPKTLPAPDTSSDKQIKN